MLKILQRRIYRLIRPKIVRSSKAPNGSIVNNFRMSTSTFIDYSQYLELADNVYIGHFNYIEASGGIKIGKGVQITNYVSITTHSSHNSLRIYGEEYQNHSNHIGYVKGTIEIGEYTFVGPYSLIMPDSKIGKNCIVSAYSLVKGNYPDNSIIRGIPAKVVGSTLDIDKTFYEQNPWLKDITK